MGKVRFKLLQVTCRNETEGSFSWGTSHQVYCALSDSLLESPDFWKKWPVWEFALFLKVLVCFCGGNRTQVGLICWQLVQDLSPKHWLLMNSIIVSSFGLEIFSLVYTLLFIFLAAHADSF